MPDKLRDHVSFIGLDFIFNLLCHFMPDICIAGLCRVLAAGSQNPLVRFFIISYRFFFFCENKAYTSTGAIVEYVVPVRRRISSTSSFPSLPYHTIN